MHYRGIYYKMQQDYKNLQWLIESGADEAITKIYL